jgi:hypothetical protein
MLGGTTRMMPAVGPPEHLAEPLSQAEARVLRYLQTSMSGPEIAGEHSHLRLANRSRAGLVGGTGIETVTSSVSGTPSLWLEVA